MALFSSLQSSMPQEGRERAPRSKLGPSHTYSLAARHAGSQTAEVPDFEAQQVVHDGEEL